MTWHHCPHCGCDLYPHTARPTDAGWVCANRLSCGNAAKAAARRAARLEDVQWMAETGESLSGAARRLGLAPDVLDRWLYRWAPELHPILARREPAVA